MALSNNIGQFEDIREVLDAALNAGGARYRLPSAREATYWRHRAYHFRRLLYRKAEESAALAPGLIPSTPYDRLVLRLDGPAVEITLRAPEGQLETLSGGALEPVKVEDTDPLLLEALELVKSHDE